uniref:Transposase element L1Md-A101/L1Md-A102/L1Md-A2 n=1 Tax=Knipowitschia caucasica TaxID=637954 RepID=A0AAV2IXN0_KNICA
MKQEFAGLRGTIVDMEQSLSACTDDITILRSQVENMAKEMVKLENKCEDLESRSRRNNIRIIGVSEDHTPSCEYVASLLTEAFTLAKQPLVDRAHRSLAPKPGPGERPRVIVARLHYYSDCANILRRAKALQKMRVRDMSISIFPDYIAKTARARAAFNDVRCQLRDIEGVRFGILHPGKLRITYRGVQRDFTSPEEAKIYIKTIESLPPEK